MTINKEVTSQKRTHFMKYDVADWWQQPHSQRVCGKHTNLVFDLLFLNDNEKH